MVPLTRGPRAADPRAPACGGSDRSGGADPGACVGCPRLSSRAVHRRGLVAVSRGSPAHKPDGGGEPSQDHEESAVQEEPPGPARRAGTQVSRNPCILAIWRTVENYPLALAESENSGRSFLYWKAANIS